MTAAEPLLRPATSDDVAAIARIWHAGWQDGHLGHVPDALTAARTERSFWTRADQRLPDTSVADVAGSVTGFVMVIHDEVEQVYVEQGHRGTGIAGRLLDQAEQRVSDAGYGSAWLAVVSGNERARRFYSRRGWKDQGPFDHQAPGPQGPITVPAHRYTKTL